jgi:hypothetical protein
MSLKFEFFEGRRKAVGKCEKDERKMSKNFKSSRMKTKRQRGKKHNFIAASTLQRVKIIQFSFLS